MKLEALVSIMTASGERRAGEVFTAGKDEAERLVFLGFARPAPAKRGGSKKKDEKGK